MSNEHVRMSSSIRRELLLRISELLSDFSNEPCLRLHGRERLRIRDTSVPAAADGKNTSSIAARAIGLYSIAKGGPTNYES